MKFSILALAAVVSLSAAQNLSGEPACATSCLLSAISAAGCAPSDMPCQCGLSAAAVGPCLTGACNATDLQQALTAGLALCSSYSATAAHSVSSTAMPGNMTTSSGLSSSSIPYSNTTTVTAKTTSFTSTRTTRAGGSGATTSPTSTISKAGAPALVAGIGGVVGILGLVAAL